MIHILLFLSSRIFAHRLKFIAVLLAATLSAPAVFSQQEAKPQDDVGEKGDVSPSGLPGIAVINPGDGSDEDPPALNAYSVTFPFLGGMIGSDLNTTRSSDGERNRFWRKGFTEVVVILFDDRAVCSGTLVDKTSIITAAHCVTRLRPAFDGKPSAVVLPIGKLSVAFPLLPGNKCYMPVSASAGAIIRQRCNVAIVGAKNIYLSKGFTENPNRFSLDVALLELAEDAPSAARVAELNDQVGRVSGFITIGGFGFSNKGSNTAGETLEVGWLSNYSLNSPSGLLQWEIPADSRSASTCKFDSGGPIFSGYQQGRIGERHLLVAVIVGLVDIQMRYSPSLSDVEGLCSGGVAVNALVNKGTMLSLRTAKPE